MIDFNSVSRFSDRINQYIDAGLEAVPQEKRSYLGGSRLGVECERALQYEYFHTPKEKGFTGRTLRIFARGHWIESAMLGWLRQGGFIIKGEQDGFSSMGDKIAGHIDGVFIGGPESVGPYPRLWECKGVQNKDWKALVKDKLRKQYPVYWAQCQTYMAFMKLTENPAMFSAVNMNTMEIYWEEVQFDLAEAQRLSDKAVRIILACQDGVQLPKISNDPAFYRCKWCAWGGRCHQ